MLSGYFLFTEIVGNEESNQHIQLQINTTAAQHLVETLPLADEDRSKFYDSKSLTNSGYTENSDIANLEYRVDKNSVKDIAFIGNALENTNNHNPILASIPPEINDSIKHKQDYSNLSNDNKKSIAFDSFKSSENVTNETDSDQLSTNVSVNFETPLSTKRDIHNIDQCFNYDFNDQEQESADLPVKLASTNPALLDSGRIATAADKTLSASAIKIIDHDHAEQNDDKEQPVGILRDIFLQVTWMVLFIYIALLIVNIIVVLS